MNTFSFFDYKLYILTILVNNFMFLCKKLMEKYMLILKSIGVVGEAVWYIKMSFNYRNLYLKKSNISRTYPITPTCYSNIINYK